MRHPGVDWLFLLRIDARSISGSGPAGWAISMRRPDMMPTRFFTSRGHFFAFARARRVRRFVA
jgi:hypothetical protein